MTTVEQLKAKHAEELRKAETEDKILALLPPVGEWRVHVYKLYGSVATVKLDQPWKHGAEPIGLDKILQVAEAMPGLPMVKVSGTFTSYIAAAQLPEYEKDNRRIDSEEPIAPWVVIGEGGPGARNGSQCTLEWRAELLGVGIVKVEIQLPFALWMRYSARRVDYIGGHRYESAKIEIDHNKLYSIFAADGSGPLAELGPMTRWAAGSPEYPSRITQAWTPLDDPATATVADFVRAMIAANA